MYIPINLQITNTMTKHLDDMLQVQETFDRSIALQTRIDTLTRKGVKSNQAIAKISETEKKLAVFLVELNNKLHQQRYVQKN